jgi:DNA primase
MIIFDGAFTLKNYSREKVRISEDTINLIKERANIVRLIGEFVHLKASGKNYKGLCPFHSEKTPSFTVSPEKGIFHCFGCGAGGNVFTFLMKMKGITFPDAVRVLGERFGIPVEDYRGASQEYEKHATLYNLNNTAAEIFSKNLFSERGKKALDYLKGRGFDEHTVKSFRLGYAFDSWDHLFRLLQARGFSADLGEEAGLIVKNKTNTGFYDRFRNRIMFPIQDSIERIIGFGGRTLGPTESGVPKYINTSESAIYHKGKHLYGFHNASEYIRKSGSVFIVEGYLDTIRMHREGLKNSVAPLGTALTEEQISSIIRYTRKIYLVFDPDDAGKKATLRSISLFHRQGIDPAVVLLPMGKDPGNFFDEYSIEDFTLLVDGAEPGIDFIVKFYTLSKNEYTANEKITILHTLSEYYENMNDDILKIELVKKLSSDLNVAEHIVMRELGKFSKADGTSRQVSGSTFLHPQHTGKMDRGIRDEQYLLLLLISNPHLFHVASSRLDENDFRGKWTRTLWNVLEKASGNKSWDSGTVFGYLENEKYVEYLSGKLMEEELTINPEDQIIDVISNLKERRIRERICAINRQLMHAELENDEGQTNELIVEKQACRYELEKMRTLRSSKSWS